MRDYLKTIISQYSTAPIMGAVLQVLNEALDPQADVGAFFSMIWNIDTAVGYGLDVWGRIVVVPRVLQVAATTNFGIGDSGGASGEGFNVAPFYAGASTTMNYALSDDAYRTLILAKALANISDCAIPTLNAILRALFPNRGACYVTDGQDMTMTYTFGFTLTPVEYAIVAQSGVLPRPTGVSVTVVTP